MNPPKEILEQAEKEFQEAQKYSKPDDYPELSPENFQNFNP